MQDVKARKVKSIFLVSTHFIFPKSQLRNQNKQEKEPGTRKRYKESISRAITGVTGISAVEWSMEIDTSTTQIYVIFRTFFGDR